MGSTASKQESPKPSPQGEDKQAHHLQFGRSLLNSIDRTALEKPDQVTLDENVQKKIKSELDRLRKEEADVRNQIQHAIEKENAERESKYKGASEGKNSNVLRNELENVRAKIERHHKKTNLGAYPGVKMAQEELIKCYRSHPEKTLDCWKQAENFKAAVAKAEKDFIASFN